MADSIKILGQTAANAATVLYTVPSLTQTTISTLVVANRTAADLSFRVSVSQAGAATDVKDYLFYDTPLAANSTLTATLGITLSEADVMRTYSSVTGVSFNLFGVETS